MSTQIENFIDAGNIGAALQAIAGIINGDPELRKKRQSFRIQKKALRLMEKYLKRIRKDFEEDGKLDEQEIAKITILEADIFRRVTELGE